MTEATEDQDVPSYYSLKAILKRSPEDLKDGVLVIVGAIIAIVWGEDVGSVELVLGGGALLAFLRLVYVGPAKKAQEEELALKGIQLGKQLANDRPLRAD